MDLPGPGGAERATGDGEVLAGRIDGPSVHQADPGDHPLPRHLLAGHSEVGGLMLDEEMGLLEGVGLVEQGQPFPGGQFPGPVLFGDPVLTATLSQVFFASVEVVDPGRHDSPLRCSVRPPVGGRPVHPVMPVRNLSTRGRDAIGR